MKEYNKLVRDKIPEIIKLNNQNPIIEILNDNDYKEELNKKLLEEVNEFINDDNIEEIADVLEVIYAILDYKEISREEVEKVRNEKKVKRGAFSRRIYLKKVE